MDVLRTNGANPQAESSTDFFSVLTRGTLDIGTGAGSKAYNSFFFQNSFTEGVDSVEKPGQSF